MESFAREDLMAAVNSVAIRSGKSAHLVPNSSNRRVEASVKIKASSVMHWSKEWHAEKGRLALLRCTATMALPSLPSGVHARESGREWLGECGVALRP